MLARLDRLVPLSPLASPVSPPPKASLIQSPDRRSVIMDPNNGMVGVQLFPESSESCLVAILDTPKKPTNKRRKNTNTPSPQATSNQRL